MDKPSRRTVWQRLENYAVVSVITALIWLFAEGKTTSEQSIQFSVQFVSPAGVQLIIEPQTTKPLKMDFICARSTLRQVQQMVERGPLELVVEEDQTNPNITQTVRFVDLLNRHEPLVRLGVTVTGVSQETMSIKVDQLRPITVKVRVDVADPRLFSGDPRPEVTSVKVLVPASIADRAAALEATVRINDPERYESNRQQKVSLPIALPPRFSDMLGSVGLKEFSPTVVPPSTDVTFTIAKRTKSFVLERVPVLALVPSGYYVSIKEADRFLSNVTIDGPPDVITRIEQDERSIWAYVRLSGDKLENSQPQSVTPQLILPQNVDVKTPPPLITLQVFKVIEKDEAESNGLPVGTP